MSASRKKRARQWRRKVLRHVERSPVDDSWQRIGAWCSAHVRSGWMRAVYSDVAPGYCAELERIELRAGRGGADIVLVIDRSNPQLHELYDLFTTMRFAVES